MFRFDFQPIGGFDLFVTGCSHFLLSERSLSFNSAMIKLTSPDGGARIVELASGKHILLDFSLTVKAPPHECVIRTGQPWP